MDYDIVSTSGRGSSGRGEMSIMIPCITMYQSSNCRFEQVISISIVVQHDTMINPYPPQPSRTQPINPPLPFPLIPQIPKPIMQPTLPPLPKLHHLWHNPQPAPKPRHRNILHPFKPPLHIPNPPLQNLPPPFLLPQHTTLLTRPSPNPTPPRPEIKIRLTLPLPQPLHNPFNPNLPFHLAPPKRQASARVTGHVARFAGAGPVAVDDEAAGVEFLEVDVAGGDGARGEGSGGEAGRFRLVDVVGLGVGEPGVELGEGGGGEFGEGEARLEVLVGLVGGWVAGGGDCGWWLL